MRRSPRVDSQVERFIEETQPRLRRALVAAYGPQAGRDATVDALAWAWSNWDRVQGLDNPAGYLYRVGQTKAREARRSIGAEPGTGSGDADGEARLPWIEPELTPALAALTEHQRVAVVLCHGFEWTHREVADLLELSASSVQNNVERGLAMLTTFVDGSVSNDVPQGMPGFDDVILSTGASYLTSAW